MFSRWYAERIIPVEKYMQETDNVAGAKKRWDSVHSEVNLK